MNQPSSPTELLTVKSLKTLGGASIFVWAVCLVLSSLMPDGTLQYWHYRILAFILSIIVTFTIINYKKFKDKFVAILLILGNTCYIFINASGINSISKNQLFTKSDVKLTAQEKKDSASGFTKRAQPSQAGFFSFLKEPDWWPDKEVITENKALKEQVNSLNSKIDNGEEKKLMLDKIQALGLQVQMLSQGKSDSEKKLIEENSRLTAQVNKLTSDLGQEKNKSAELTKQLNTATKNYNDLLAKCSNSDKTISSLTDQVFSLKADITGLNKLLAECNKNLTGCLNSRGNDKYAELYRACFTNYTNVISALTKARDSLTACLKKDQMKIPIRKSEPKINK